MVEIVQCKLTRTGTASISSSMDGWDSRLRPFLGLGVSLLGGSGGGISSDSHSAAGVGSGEAAAS